MMLRLKQALRGAYPDMGGLAQNYTELIGQLDYGFPFVQIDRSLGGDS